MFTAELLKHVATSGIDVTEAFRRTGAGVSQATGGRQVPAVYSQFFGSAVLGAAATPGPSARPPASSGKASGGVRVTVESPYGAVEATSRSRGDLYLDGEFLATARAGGTIRLDGVETGSHVLEMRYEAGQIESMAGKSFVSVWKQSLYGAG